MDVESLNTDGAIWEVAVVRGYVILRFPQALLSDGNPCTMILTPQESHTAGCELIRLAKEAISGTESDKS